jgi:hypothetical protein
MNTVRMPLAARNDAWIETAPGAIAPFASNGE